MRHPPSTFEREVVVRRIALPVSALRLTEDFAVDPTALTTTWRAPARVGRTHVEVEVAAWSARASELRIIPGTRHLHLWTARRRRRYFDSAHRVADELASQAAA